MRALTSTHGSAKSANLFKTMSPNSSTLDFIARFSVIGGTQRGKEIMGLTEGESMQEGTLVFILIEVPMQRADGFEDGQEGRTES